jgi:hypothetical protein
VTDPPPEGTLPTGRPPMLTDEVFGRIVQVVRAGNYLKVAAQFAGVGNSTLKLWLHRGRLAAAAAERGDTVPPVEQRYLDFLAAVSQAETHAEVTAATAWRSRVTEDWRAARDYLRYRHPDRWRAVTAVTLRPEEAEQRIDAAVTEALTALGVDTTPGALDADTAALLNELTDDQPEDDA